MKKTLLFSLALVTGLSMVAQHNRYGKPVLRQLKNVDQNLDLKSELTPIKNVTLPMVKSAKTRSVPPYPVIGTSANLFTSQVEDQGCLSYNADINTIAFVHRKSVAWTGFPNANSGSIQVDFSSNGGLTWDSTIVHANTTTNIGRYPGGVIYNPAGNTTVGNARIFVSGPSLTTIPAQAFDGNYFSSGPLTPGAITTSDMQKYLSVGNTNPAYDSLGFARVNHFEAAGNVWVAGRIAGDHAVSTFVGLQMRGVGLMKGVWNTGTSMFDYTLTKLTPQTMQNVPGGYPYLLADGHVAFGPNGQIGYATISGVVAGATGSARGVQPIVYKTTDAGQTWNQVLANYQWQTNNPELEACVVANANIASTPGVAIPNFSDNNGTDIVVDNNGILHYITTIEAGYSDHADSLFYSYTGYYDYNISHPYIIDFMTDGTPGMGWKTQLIDSILTAPPDVNNASNPWGQGGAGVGYNNRLQAARTAAGDVIMVTWSDSDPAVTGNNDNGAPDIQMVAYKPSTNMLSPKMMVTYGLGELYFHFTSNIAMTVSPGVYNVPITYTQSSAGTFDPNTQVNHAYVNDGTVTDAQINVPAPPLCVAAGINSANTAIATVAQNFPNPFSKSTTINVTLNQNEDINLTVFNTVGQLVVSKNVKGVVGVNTIEVDAANLTSGIYFYTVKAGDNKISKKMMIQK